MKRKLLFLVGAVVFIFIFTYGLLKLNETINSDILEGLEGEIYYTKRVDDILTLYKSDADLENEKLIYSHKGKGKDSYGSYNDNIIDFFYDVESGSISFMEYMMVNLQDTHLLVFHKIRNILYIIPWGT